MDYDDWRPFYDAIREEFHYDAARDEAAAGWLAQRLAGSGANIEKTWSDLDRIFGGRPAVVLGASDDAPRSLAKAPRGNRIIAADGATTAALEVGVVPHLIVTDLDGIVEHEVEAARRGAFVAVHAHGDNMPAMQQWLPLFPPAKLVGTCQGPVVPPLRNFGGFTDGDRAAFVAHGLGADPILLLGFEFEGPVGRYAGTYDPATKPRKLWWSRRLLQELSARGAHLTFGSR